MVPHSDRGIADFAFVAVAAAVARTCLAAWRDLRRIPSSHRSRLWGWHDSADPWARAAAAAAGYALGRVQGYLQHPPLTYPLPQLHSVADRQHQSHQNRDQQS